MRARRSEAGTPTVTVASVGRRLTGAAALSAVVVATAMGTTATLGAPQYWPWLLTGLPEQSSQPDPRALRRLQHNRRSEMRPRC